MREAQQLDDLDIDYANIKNIQNQSIMTLYEEECEESVSGKLRSIMGQTAQ